MTHITIRMGMVICMKTTLNLPDALYRDLKQKAAAEDRTITSVVEQALRAALAAGPDGPNAAPLPTWPGGSSRGYLVDLTDSRAVWDALDEPA